MLSSGARKVSPLSSQAAPCSGRSPWQPGVPSERCSPAACTLLASKPTFGQQRVPRAPRVLLTAAFLHTRSSVQRCALDSRGRRGLGAGAVLMWLSCALQGHEGEVAHVGGLSCGQGWLAGVAVPKVWLGGCCSCKPGVQWPGRAPPRRSAVSVWLLLIVRAVVVPQTVAANGRTGLM